LQCARHLQHIGRLWATGFVVFLSGSFQVPSAQSVILFILALCYATAVSFLNATVLVRLGPFYNRFAVFPERLPS
jgi:hypothetical protein